MPIVPDDKNWTWVLERACPDCGFDASRFPAVEVAAAVRANADAWRPILADPRAAVRPDDATWSALEYGCHVRDVYRLYRYRLGLMLDHDDPAFPNWDQDVTAVEERYDLQDPATVAAELAVAAEELAAAFDGVAGDVWLRAGRRSDGASFTVDTFARYLVHDPIHHVVDAEVGYRSLGDG